MSAHPVRLGAVRGAIAEASLSGMIVSDLVNVRWLTGFTGSNGVLIIVADGATLVTDGRYADQAAHQLAAAGVDVDLEVVAAGSPLTEGMARRSAGLGHRPVAVEADHVTMSTHGRWSEALPVTLAPTSGIVEALRRRKDAEEVACIERAARIADRALATVASGITAGQTEAAIRNRLEVQMRESGAQGPSYETIVASGPVHAAAPHHRPTDRRLEEGETVVIDVGALLDGYHSDMTRSYVVGAPDARQSAVYGALLDAQCAGLAAVGPGVPAAEVDAVCRRVLAAAGLDDWFTHGTGHGVGLLIHEEPYLTRRSNAVLAVGDVVTVEPGVYREGFGGLRIEDLVVVTEDGCRVLTNSPKDAPCLPSPPMT